MLNIFRYMKQFKGTVVVIVVLLVIQAFCDLALPTYTSNIVDVGISQGGIEETLPKQIRESSMDDLKLFLDETDAELLDDCYEKTDETVETTASVFGAATVEQIAQYIQDAASSPEAMQSMMRQDPSAVSGSAMSGAVMQALAEPQEMTTTVYRLKKDIKKSIPDVWLEEIEDALEKPEMFYGMMAAAQDSDNGEGISAGQGSLLGEDRQKMMEQMFEILLPSTEPVRRREILDDMLGTYDSMWDTMSKNLIYQFVKQEYEETGMDMEAYQKAYLWKTGAKMLGVALGIMVTMILSGFLASRAAAKTAMNLRTRMFANVLGFSSKEMNQFSTASLITRSTNDIQQVQQVLVLILRMILYAPILGVGAVLKVINGKTGMAWIIGVAIGAIMCLVLVLFVVAMPKFKKMQILVDRVNQVAREILTGLQVIRAFSREKHEEKRFDGANHDLMSTQLFVGRVMSGMMPAMMLIMYMINIMILWFGAKGIDAGNLQVGDMIAFITYTMQIVMSFLMLTMMSIMLPRAGVAAKRIDEVIAAKPEIVDKADAKEIAKEVQKGVVAFEHVNFAYPGADGNVLSDITFTANPGETTAIIGSAGSGKSTLLNLIPRFYDVSSGAVKIDGIDVRDLKQRALRAMLGYVPQKGVLFSGTIESNIKFGNQTASDELMKQSAQIAQATEFIEEKPERYDSSIAQGGSNVSGGQKQRLSIARAIAKEPKIYMFDDSFSALDFKTDAALRRALKEKTRAATVIIVAQRISTIMHAEQILVLDEGKVVGKGTHQELLKTCEVYQQIASSQLSQAELEAVGHVEGK